MIGNSATPCLTPTSPERPPTTSPSRLLCRSFLSLRSCADPTRGIGSALFQAPRDDLVWVDPDHFTAVIGPRRFQIAKRFRQSSDLDPTGDPWVYRREIVDHERNLRVACDIRELLGSPHSLSPDVERVELVVEEEPNRRVLNGSVRRHRRQPRKQLAFQIGLLCWCKQMSS